MRVLVAVLFWAACGDGGRFADADTLGSSDVNNASTCNTLEQKGEIAHLHMVSAVEPTPTGGTLAPGTYVLTDVTRYGVERPDERDYIVVITIAWDGTRAEFVSSRTISGQTRVSRLTTTVTVAGVHLTTRDVCPTTTETHYQYSVTPNGFDLFGQFYGSRMVQHFERL